MYKKKHRTEDWLFLGLGLMHECVERVVEGVHEVGVVDRGLGAWKARGVVFKM